MAFHLDNLHQGLQQLSWGNLKETKEHVDFLIKYLENSNETNNMLESKIARCIRYGILNLETLPIFLKHNIVNFTKLDLFSKELLQTLQNVKKSQAQNFKKNLSSSYEEKYGTSLEFINFNASKGSHILDTSFLD